MLQQQNQHSYSSSNDYYEQAKIQQHLNRKGESFISQVSMIWSIVKYNRWRCFPPLEPKNDEINSNGSSSAFFFRY